MIGVATVVLKFHDVLFGAWGWYRRRWDDLARLEGHWVQETSIPDRPFSYARVSFHRGRHQYVYEGLGFDRAGAKKAVWDSEVFLRSSDGREIVFSALSQLIDPAPGVIADRLRVFGWLRPTGSQFFRGDVYDTGGRAGRPDQFTLEARRIPTDAIRRYLDGKRAPETDHHRREIARRFLDEHPRPAESAAHE